MVASLREMGIEHDAGPLDWEESEEDSEDDEESDEDDDGDDGGSDYETVVETK